MKIKKMVHFLVRWSIFWSIRKKIFGLWTSVTPPVRLGATESTASATCFIPGVLATNVPVRATASKVYDAAVTGLSRDRS